MFSRISYCNRAVEVGMAGGRFGRGEVHRFTVDLTDGESEKLEALAQQLGITKGAAVRRLIDAASIPRREQGERLCVCSGDRKVAEIAGT